MNERKETSTPRNERTFERVPAPEPVNEALSGATFPPGFRLSSGMRGALAVAFLFPALLTSCTINTPTAPTPDPVPIRPQPTTRPFSPAQNEIIATEVKRLLNLFDKDNTAFVVKSNISSDQLQDVVSYMVNDVRTAKLTDRPEMSRYHREVALLRAILLTDMPKDIERDSRQRFVDHLAKAGAWDPVNGKLEELDLTLRFVYRLAGLYDEPGRAACIRTVRDLEQKLNSVSDADLLKYVDKQIAAMQGVDSVRYFAELRNLDELLKQPADKQDPMIAKLKLDTRPGWQEFGTRWTYTDPDRKGQFASWELAVDTTSNPDKSINVTLRSSWSRGVFAKAPLKRFLELVEKNSVHTLVDEAVASYRRENEDANRIAAMNFDLPERGVITYLRYFPGDYDRTISSTLLSSCVMARAWRHNYPSRVQVAPVAISNDPLRHLEGQLDRYYKAGSRCFVLDFYCHGAESFLGAGGGGINGTQLSALMMRFPDAKFVVTTVACYGGGLQPSFAKEIVQHPSLQNRVSVVTQSKPTVTNEVGTIREYTTDKIEWDGLNGSRFYYYLSKSMLGRQPTKLGPALRDADLRTKGQSSLDADVLLDGKLLSEVPSCPDFNPGEAA